MNLPNFSEAPVFDPDIDEPYDDAPTPDEPPEPEPLTEDKLDDIAADIADAAAWFRSHELPECPAVEEAVTAAGALLAELEAARRRIADLEALPTVREYAATIRPNVYPAPGNHVRCGTADIALEEASRAGGAAWVRDVAQHPWIELSAEPPF